MNSQYFVFNDKEYALDMEAFMAFVSKSPPQERQVTTNISQYYDRGDDDDIDDKEASSPIEMQRKEISETKSILNEAFVNIRYDFVKNLFNTLASPVVSSDGNLLEALTIGQIISFNTLLDEGIIVCVNE